MMKNMYSINFVCLFMLLITVINGNREFEVGVGVVLDAESLEGKMGLRDSRRQVTCAATTDLDKYVPYLKVDSTSSGSHNDLVHQTFLQEFNAAVEDVKITANRSIYVDFTIPYAKGEVSIIFKSLKREFWFIIIAYFILAGGAIWILEHMVSTEFRGPLCQHTGMLFFLFSTLVLAQKEKFRRSLSRLVVVVWVLVVLILTSTYTASLLSMADVGGSDVNRLEYFSMTTFNPHHAREILDFGNGGSGSGGGGGGGCYRSAARGQLREMDTGALRRWWKKIWCFLRNTAPRH